MTFVKLFVHHHHLFASSFVCTQIRTFKSNATPSRIYPLEPQQNRKRARAHHSSRTQDSALPLGAFDESSPQFQTHHTTTSSSSSSPRASEYSRSRSVSVPPAPVANISRIQPQKLPPTGNTVIQTDTPTDIHTHTHAVEFCSCCASHTRREKSEAPRTTV